jgi:hypothetical protein
MAKSALKKRAVRIAPARHIDTMVNGLIPALPCLPPEWRAPEPDLRTARQRINQLLTKTADPTIINNNDDRDILPRP